MYRFLWYHDRFSSDSPEWPTSIAARSKA
jgi:hypothetical protein